MGKPILYGTTDEFLIHFGLNDIRDLPRLEEFGDLIGESISEDLVSVISEQRPANAAQDEPELAMNEVQSATVIDDSRD